MPEAHSSRGAIRFGAFEVDLHSGELRKQGLKVKLQEQPFQILQILLEHPGAVVTREELQKRIWPDTFVDFEHGVYNAVKRLREALGDTADTPRFIETLPRRGYRFIGTVNGNAQVAPGDGSPPIVEPHALPRTGRRTLRTGILTGLGLAALLLVMLGLTPHKWWQHLRGRSDVPRIQSLAVLPLQNLSGDSTQEYFADAMTEELITELSRISALKVISRTSVMRYKKTDKPLPEIARELGVEGIVEGSVLRSGDHVRITAQLIYAPKDTNLWAQTYDRDLRDVLSLQSAVAGAIADEIQVKVTPREQLRLKTVRPVNRKALDAYVDGRYHLDKATQLEFHKGLENQYEEEFHKAMAAFDLAIREDPNYVAAYLGIFDVGTSGMLVPHWNFVPKARAALARALQLDDSLVEAHVYAARMLYIVDWDWAAAQKEFQRAIDLNPNSADAHKLYADYLGQMGRGEEARKESELAQQLNPEYNMFVDFFPQYWSPDKDREYLDERDPNNPMLRAVLGNRYQRAGRYKEAVEQYIKLAKLYGYYDQVKILQRGYAGGDYKGAIRDWMKAWDALSKRQHLPPFWPSWLYANLGDKDQAFAWLEKAYQEHDGSMVQLKDNPMWDPIRSDPRFTDLLRRVGLPP